MIATFRTGAIAAAVSLAGLASTAHAASVLNITDYNAIVLGDYTARNSDVEGRLAVGGNADLTSYAVGSKLPSSSKGTNGLVVGGNLKATDGQLHNGDLAVGGANNSNRFTVRDGTTTTSVNFDFASLGAQLKDTSASLSQYANTAATVNNYGALQLNGSEAGLNVFSITAAQLSSAHGLSISVAPGSQVLVNVSGSAATWQNMGINLNGLSSANVLFNFYEATDLTMSGIGINGSILAPNTNVKFDNGQLNGILIAGNFQGTGELHNTGYAGDLLTPTNPVVPGVPEPATWAMLLLGFGVIGAAMRKRPAKRTVCYS